MDTISFKLDAFEGPLDLLLHLVSKHKLNIYDIEISLLLEQYLAYLDGIETKDYEQAADFLEMAARLIYIKTCYLLPQPEEAEELKKELQGRMIEYSLCKLAAQRLREDYAGGNVFVRQPVKLPVNKTYTRLHDKQELFDAYMMISAKVKEYKPLRANMFSPIVSKRIVSVESKITDILSRLYSHGSFEMSKLYEGMEDRSERIAAFLAVLELTKSGRIFLNDDNTLIELRQNVPDDESVQPAESLTEMPVSEEIETVSHADAAEDDAPAEDDVPAEETFEEAPQEDVSDAAESAGMPPFEEEVTITEQEDTEEKAEDDAPGEKPPITEEVPAEDETKADITEEKPARNYSVQFAQSTYTMTLRVEDEVDNENEPLTEDDPEYEKAPISEAETVIEISEDTRSNVTAEPVGEFVSLFDEIENSEDNRTYEPVAVAAFAPMTQQSEESTEVFETVSEETVRTNIKPNYYARRYYWGCAPLMNGRRACREAWRLRI